MLRIIGDVHGKTGGYHRLVDELSDKDFSVQVGDMGFNYEHLNTLCPFHHKVLGGNHDNYSKDSEGKFYIQTPHFLGDYGIQHINGVGEFFFMRGELSVDKSSRLDGMNWWIDEELTYTSLCSALDFYKFHKPEFVITHGCPSSVSDLFSSFSSQYAMDYFGCELPSMTARVLQEMFEYHQPNTWVFGHYHNDKIEIINGTEFICVDELSCIDFDRI